MEATSSVALGRAVQLAGNPALRFSGCSGRCWCEMCDVVGPFSWSSFKFWEVLLRPSSYWQGHMICSEYVQSMIEIHSDVNLQF